MATEPLRERERVPDGDLDALLTAQFLVAWAGESGRLDWWRSTLVSRYGGFDLFGRLTPQTASWVVLQAVRETARRHDAERRAQGGEADHKLTLFHLGFERDEQADERLQHHKRSGKPPTTALPLLRDFIHLPTEGDDDDGDDEAQELPALREGESGPHQPELHEGKTKPPRPFTENTLLAAMETAGRSIDDEQLRDAMRGRGLGTPATRASIVETLLSRAYVRRDKKALRVTDLGRYLIAIIADPMLKSAELTGEWEWKLGEIERGRVARAAFMQEIRDRIQALLATGLSPHNEHGGIGLCPRCRAEVIEGREAWGCSRWREDCAFRLPKVYRGVPLQREQVRDLLFRGVHLRPVTIDGAPRIVCRTATGELIDLEPPSRDAQRPGKPAKRAPRRGNAAGG